MAAEGVFEPKLQDAVRAVDLAQLPVLTADKPAKG